MRTSIEDTFCGILVSPLYLLNQFISPVISLILPNFYSLKRDPAVNAESEFEAFANLNGRTDVEGCCWWGRGLLQMKGPCAFGRLNYYLGARAARESRPSMYEGIDFCVNPEAICGSQYRHELVWISALFKWIDTVQNHEDGEWNYMEQLRVFGDNMFEDQFFVKEVNAIVEVGCRHPPCREAGCVSFPCDGAYSGNENSAVNRAFLTFNILGLWDNFEESLGGSNSPTPVPSICPDCTGSPTLLPTNTPTATPLVDFTSAPSAAPSREVTVLNRRFNDFQEHLINRRSLLESTVFVSETESGLADSTLYTLDGLLSVLKDLTTKGTDDGSGANLMFYIGQDNDKNFSYGLVNMALFLAHATTRGLRFDSCEEVNHHLIEGKLPISNSCGQNSQSYNEDLCPMADVARECPLDNNMNVEQASVGTSNAPKFFCAPKSTNPFTGYFDPSSGNIEASEPFASAIGRKDVEGCCWWGRGMLHSSGVCDIGRFNFIFGLPAFKDGRPSARYNIDFCVYPEALCSDFTIPPSTFNKFPTTIDTSDIRYLLALHYWMSNVQDFSWGFWNYRERLKLFVDGGMTDDSFVDEFSDIILDSSRDGPLRKANFKQILEILFLEVDVSLSPSEGSTTYTSLQPSPSGDSTDVQLPMDTLTDADIQSDATIVQTIENPPPTENVQDTPQSTAPVQLPTSPLLPGVSLEPDFPDFSSTGDSVEPIATKPDTKPDVDVPPPTSPPFLNKVFEYSSGYSIHTSSVVGVCICTSIASIAHILFILV